MVDTSQNRTTYSVHPIGYVHADDQEQRYEIEILPAYRAALQQLDAFSHVIVIWWADKQDQPANRSILTTDLPYAPGVHAGVFACRSEYRPNPIAITTMPILGLDLEKGIVSLPWIDAYDGTPVLDLKPYISVTDRIRDFHLASWLEGWPEWMEDAGEFFAENETNFGAE